jgi:hypothetical protein
MVQSFVEVELRDLQGEDWRRDFASSITLLSCSTAYVQCVVARTPHARLRVGLHLHENYPQEALWVELSSPGEVLPPPFLRRLSKQVECLAAEHLGERQCGIVLAALAEIIDGNLLLPCFREVRQCRDLVQEKGWSMGVDEKRGVVCIQSGTGLYAMTVTLHIPTDYPDAALGLHVGKTNFPLSMVERFAAQADEVVRRCVLGWSSARALAVTGEAGCAILDDNAKETSEGGVRLTKERLASLKHDVEALKDVQDLRKKAEEATKKAAAHAGGSKEPVDAGAARKARRALRALTHSEMERDKADEEADAICEHDSASTRALMPVVTFLIANCATLPSANCQGCSRPVLNSDPKVQARVESKKGPRRCIMSSCGCWFHHTCLDKFLTEPPFGKLCARHGRRICHPDWDQSDAKLEKAWAMKKAKEREIAEVQFMFA